MKQLKMKIISAAAAISAMATTGITAFATDSVSSSTAATGLTNLLKDVSGWLVGISAAVGGLCIVYFCIRRSTADEMDQKKWNNRIITAIVSTIGAVVGTSLLAVITSYFQ